MTTQLIKISEVAFNGELKQTVNARELHAFLEVKSRFNDWIQRQIECYGFVQHIDFVTILVHEYSPPRKDYYITLDMAKELSMVERNDKGREARRYFIECERKLKESKNLTPAELLLVQAQLLVEQERRTALLEAEQKSLATRQQAIEDRVALLDSGTGYMSVRGFCKVHHLPCPLHLAKQYGKALSKICRDRGLPIGQVVDEAFGTVGSYPVELIAEYFGLGK